MSDMSEMHSSTVSIQSSYSNESRFQSNYGTNFPIKGVLKRSKSFGNNRHSDEFGSSTLLNESNVGQFLLSLEGLSWDHLSLIKMSLDRERCTTLSMTQLLQIIRILCNNVLEKPENAQIIAQLCMDIHHQQQTKIHTLTDHKYIFLESLTNCLREWFNERDKLRFTTGGARRWIGYISFLLEMYHNLKTIDFKMVETIGKQSNVQSKMVNRKIGSNESTNSDDSEDNCSNVDNNSADEEVSRAFSSDPGISDTDESLSNRQSNNGNNNRRSSMDIEQKIINSVLLKQQKQFASLLIDSFQVILSNPNSTPAEIECMQTGFRKCGMINLIDYISIVWFCF